MGKRIRNTSKTREELFVNTINGYTKTTRSVDIHGGCQYLNDEGNSCAIGRELGRDKAKNLQQSAKVCLIIDILPKRIQAMGGGFLSNIQELHDTGENWDLDGLSSHGQRRANDIIETYELNVPEL